MRGKKGRPVPGHLHPIIGIYTTRRPPYTQRGGNHSTGDVCQCLNGRIGAVMVGSGIGFVFCGCLCGGSHVHPDRQGDTEEEGDAAGMQQQGACDPRGPAWRAVLAGESLAAGGDASAVLLVHLVEHVRC